ncbi:MAG: hypothetical protein HRT77_00640 [Halioglobus sp.]|nr:hypothetical protein [Halioglobus sp.]
MSLVQAFRNDPHDCAWTSVHQALVRARRVAGHHAVVEPLDQMRADTLRGARDEGKLARKAAGIRDKMRAYLVSHGQPVKGQFHLKQGVGGIVDIEFVLQYAVMAQPHRVVELACWSDKVRILEVLSREGLFEPQQCEALIQGCLARLSAAHQLSLQRLQDVVPADRYARAAVRVKWQQLFQPYVDRGPQETGNEEIGVV